MLGQAGWDQDFLQGILSVHIFLQPFDQQRQKELEGVFRAFGIQNLEVEKHLKKADRSLEYFVVCF